MQPRSLHVQASELEQPAASSGDLKQLKLKQFLASQTDPRRIDDAPSAPPSSAGPTLAAQLQSLKPVLSSVLRSLISENSSVAAWSKAALQFDQVSGKSASPSSLDKLNEDSASVLDLGARLAVSSSNERRLQNQLSASIAEIAEVRSNSRKSSDISLARENQELRSQLAAAQRARAQSASQIEQQLQSKCACLESENQFLESKCRRLQTENQQLSDLSQSLPASFREEQHSVLSEISGLKKEYEELLSAHMTVRADVKMLVEEKNAMMAQLANKDYECGTLSADLKSCKSKISRLESELRSRTGESLNGSETATVSAASLAGSPQLEPFVPTNRSAGSRTTPWASVSPTVPTSRSFVPFPASPADLRANGHLPAAAKASSIDPLHTASDDSRYSPSQVGEVSEEASAGGQDSQQYSQKMRALLDLVSTLDSRLLSLDAM